MRSEYATVFSRSFSPLFISDQKAIQRRERIPSLPSHEQQQMGPAASCRRSSLPHQVASQARTPAGLLARAARGNTGSASNAHILAIAHTIGHEPTDNNSGIASGVRNSVRKTQVLPIASAASR